jgi:hypothetical protein
MSDNLPAVPGSVPLRARDIHYEVALDHEPPHAAALVGETVADTPDDRLTIRPDYLKPEIVRHHARHLGYRGAVHATRLPEYTLKVAFYAPIGAAKIAGRLIRWWHVTEQTMLRSEIAAAGDARQWMSMHKEGKQTRKVRGLFLAVTAGIPIAVVAFLLVKGQWWSWLALALAVAVAAPWLAHHGHSPDKPIVRPAVVTPRFRLINADIILRAYYAASLGDPEKPGQQITFGSTMAREADGSGVDVDLPYGKGLKDAVDAKPGIASGLDVTESQVFLRRDRTSYRRHHLWVADRDPLAVPVGRTPLLACKQTDIWKPAPIGLDERGQLVKVPVLWHSLLFGALPRMGKTWSARLIGLYAALDPYCRLDVFDAKGSPDWRKFALVADSCAFGLTPTRDGKPPEILLRTLEGIREDVEDRYTRLSGLPTHVCPEGKLTRDIARDPRYRMPARVVILDEVQEYFELGSISHQIAELLVYLVKVAPQAGVSILTATQRPSGIGSGGEVAKRFTAFRDMHQLRFSLRTPEWRVSEMVLGAGALGEGLDSSKLLPEYKGVGILRGASDHSPTVRCFTCDDRDAEKVLTAARAHRERAGTLSGMALGESTPKAEASILEDVLAVLGDLPALPWETLAPLLQQRWPERYQDATADSVSARCRGLGVPSKDVKYQGRSLMGCRREHVMAVVQRQAAP